MLDLQGFERYLMRKARSINTIACYLRDVRAFLQWYNGGWESIYEMILITYKRYLNQKGCSIITANWKLAGVNAFCRYLYDAQVLPEAYTVKLTKNRDKPEYKGVPVDDLRRLREYIHETGNLMYICIIELLLGTGLRVSELAGLTLNNIKLEKNQRIRVLGKCNVYRT